MGQWAAVCRPLPYWYCNIRSGFHSATILVSREGWLRLPTSHEPMSMGLHLTHSICYLASDATSLPSVPPGSKVKHSPVTSSPRPTQLALLAAPSPSPSPPPLQRQLRRLVIVTDTSPWRTFDQGPEDHESIERGTYCCSLPPEWTYNQSAPFLFYTFFS